jgi:hypothetical protein
MFETYYPPQKKEAMKLIGIAGRAHSGKDTVANLLCARHGFTRYAFAMPIKDGLMAMLRLTRAEVDGADKDKPLDRLGGITTRRLMQTLGTDWGRNMIGEDLWLRMAEYWLGYHRQFSARIVVSDVRYENEAAWVRRQGGEIWHVERRDREPVERHSSEAGIAIVVGVDSVIANDEGLEQLEAQVRAAILGERVVTAIAL